ncbi:hypothetical protein D1164_18865 [Mariniphaga sediminis]|uniref:Uncharacterized protein n=1 Tax=Mariniphaga sediminis TaxID=1628158 RepID=A0A399CV03_9BACT|nr:hypothetical protein D1164_18865 [Mariniphaga sediminis]
MGNEPVCRQKIHKRKRYALNRGKPTSYPIFLFETKANMKECSLQKQFSWVKQALLCQEKN